MSYEPGTYDLVLKAAGTESVVVGLANVLLEPYHRYDLVAVRENNIARIEVLDRGEYTAEISQLFIG